MPATRPQFRRWDGSSSLRSRAQIVTNSRATRQASWVASLLVCIHRGMAAKIAAPHSPAREGTRRIPIRQVSITATTEAIILGSRAVTSLRPIRW